MTPKPPINYQVSQPQSVTEQFQDLFTRAELMGWRNLFLRASRYVMDELAYDPLHFGESRGILPQLQLVLRIAFAPPLYVEFAIHELCRQVFIRHFGIRC